MREIKLRGKSEVTGEWVVGTYIDGYIIRGVIEANSDYIAIENWEPVHPESVGQYTGLKDKDGKEIYEGDVLTSHEYPFQEDGVYNYHGVVEWVDEAGAFVITKRIVNSSKRGISDGIAEYMEDMGLFEIIGNIYEKPELIK